MINTTKLRQWQKELNRLTAETGISLEEVCEYMNLEYQNNIGFYIKLPMKKRTLIGIGMAFRQPVEVINRWLTHYGMKKRLYSKDISEDMIWIYLISRNYKDDSGEFNYYRMYEECQETAFATYSMMWNELTDGSIDTSDVDKRLREIRGGEIIEEIRELVINNLDSFKTAYSRARRMLAEYLNCILETSGRASGKGERISLISLRGWLDDSMINYLSGSVETVNVTDMRSGERHAGIKQVPKSRRSHISMALALGMGREEVDKYLDLMGYLPLNEDESDEEAQLINELERWESEHLLQKQLKDKYINKSRGIDMTPEEELQAVSDMLMLRQELRVRYRIRGREFPYFKG